MTTRLVITDRRGGGASDESRSWRSSDERRSWRSAACAGSFAGHTLRCAALAACVLCTAVAGRANEPAAAERSAATASADLTPALLLDDLETGSREKQARLLRLRLQLQRLTEESRRIRESTMPPEIARDAATVDPPPAPGIDTHPTAPPPDAHAVPQPPDEDPPQPTEPAGDQQGAQAAPTMAAAASHATETVVGASINRLALGDSLFGTGQTDLALQAYKNIELIKIAAADRYWIEYQIANCHRRLGDIPEAQLRYRKLAGLVDAGWCAAHARWWLDALDTRAELQRDLQTVRNSLKAIEEQLNAEPPK